MVVCCLPRYKVAGVVTYVLREISARRENCFLDVGTCTETSFSSPAAKKMQILRQLDVHPKVREEADILVRTFSGAIGKYNQRIVAQNKLSIPSTSTLTPVCLLVTKAGFENFPRVYKYLYSIK